MYTTTIAQPASQLGIELDALLDEDVIYSRIVFVSAFTALRTVLRLRDRLLASYDRGTTVRLVIGIDLGGTSLEVLRELVNWDCEIYVFHNPFPRATFHPKIYLFQAETHASLFIGSNNLTDGGMYTNYEAATHLSFDFPQDSPIFSNIIDPLLSFIKPAGQTVCRLDNNVIETLIARGMVPTEQEARQSRRASQADRDRDTGEAPPNPFSATSTPMAPLLPPGLRPDRLPRLGADDEGPTEEEVSPPSAEPPPQGVLVWQKKLPKTDALQVEPGSHHVGGVRLTQARFENPLGNRIDQTTYFRRLFGDYEWEPEPGGRPDQEHTFVPMRIFIRGVDYGIRNFEISHKPSGEAGQANYTTILRWGRNFNSTIVSENLTERMFSLYETPDAEAGFLIDITDE